MADRRVFFYDQLVAEDELNEAFAKMEESITEVLVGHGLYGMQSGGTVTQAAAGPNKTVDITAFRGVDKAGYRLYHGSNLASVDCSTDENGADNTPTAGKERYISLFLEFNRSTSDPRVDGVGQTVYFVQDESYAIRIVAGAEAAIAVPPTCPLPALDSTDILLCDILLTDPWTQILNADISTARREDFIRDGTNAWKTIRHILEDFVAGTPTVSAQWTFEDYIKMIGNTGYILGDQPSAGTNDAIMRVYQGHAFSTGYPTMWQDDAGDLWFTNNCYWDDATTKWKPTDNTKDAFAMRKKDTALTFFYKHQPYMQAGGWAKDTVQFNRLNLAAGGSWGGDTAYWDAAWTHGHGGFTASGAALTENDYDEERPGGAKYVRYLQTTGAGASLVWDIATNDGELWDISARAIAFRSAKTAGATIWKGDAFKNNGGVLTEVPAGGEVDVRAILNDPVLAGVDVTMVVNGTTIEVNVVGLAAENLNWKVEIDAVVLRADEICGNSW